MFEAGVLAFGVLPDDNNINIIMARGKAREVETINKRSIEIKLLPKLNIEGTDATTHGGDESTLETDLVLPNRIEDLRRHGLHVAVDLELLKVDGRMHGLHDLLHRARHHRPDPVARDQRHRPRRPVARPVHVRHGSGRDPPREEEVL